MKASYYVTYLPKPHLHTNAAGGHAGIGTTPEESMKASHYWANQLPYVVTVPISKAPRWAVEEAELAERQQNPF